MAQSKGKDDKPKRTLTVAGRQKKVQTVRERTAVNAQDKPKRIRKGAAKLANPVKKLNKVGGGKEYHIPLPDNKAGRFLRRRARLWPKFFGEAWAEIRQVTWPNRKQTIRLTFAVFIFALIFGIMVALLDYGLDKLFREVIVNNE